jgi:hypothetical protein
MLLLLLLLVVAVVCSHHYYCVLLVLQRLAMGWTAGDRNPLGTRFSAPVQTGLRPSQPPLKWVTGFFPGGKAAGAVLLSAMRDITRKAIESHCVRERWKDFSGRAVLLTNDLIFLYQQQLLFSVWRNSPSRAGASTCSQFLYHTQWHITVSRTPLDEWSARRRDLYLKTHNT